MDMNELELSGNFEEDLYLGLKGDRGDRGDRGDKGDKGDRGDPGYVNYDLAGNGLPNVEINGDFQQVEMDTTEIHANSLTSYSVIHLNLAYRGLVVKGVTATFFPCTNVAIINLLGQLVYVTMFINDGTVSIRADFFTTVPSVDAADDGKIAQVVEGKWSAADLKDHAEIKKLRQDIKDIISDMNYDEIEITSITNNIGTVEKGTDVSEMTVTWSLNKDPVSQTLGGEAVDIGLRKATVSMEGRTSVTLVVTDERGLTVSKSTKYNAYNGVYHGALDADAVIDSDAVNSMAKTLQSGLAGTFKFTAVAGQKLTFAAPVSYGEPSKFVIGGLDYTWDKINNEPFEHENESGHKENYNIWQNTEVTTGNRTLSITVVK